MSDGIAGSNRLLDREVDWHCSQTALPLVLTKQVAEQLRGLAILIGEKSLFKKKILFI